MASVEDNGYPVIVDPHDRGLVARSPDPGALARFDEALRLQNEERAAINNGLLPTNDADLETFLSENDSINGESFRIPVNPELGIITAEFFIAADRVPANSPVFLHGDNRDYDPNFDPTKSRVSMMLDFETGKGVMLVNGSTMEVVIAPEIDGPDLPDLPKITIFGKEIVDLPDLPDIGVFPGYHQTLRADPQAIHVNPDFTPSDSDSFINIDTLPNGDVEIVFHAADGFDDVVRQLSDIPGADVPFDGAPEIDNRIVFSSNGQNLPPEITIEGDPYPSVGFYQWNEGEAEEIMRRDEKHFWDMADWQDLWDGPAG